MSTSMRLGRRSLLLALLGWLTWLAAPVPCARASAFDLMSGQWEGRPETQPEQGPFLFELGPSPSRRFSLCRLAAAGFNAELIATGSYQVTANEGDPHVTLTVERIYQPAANQEQPSADFAGWTLQTGATATCVLSGGTPQLLLDATDPTDGSRKVRFLMLPLGSQSLERKSS